MPTHYPAQPDPENPLVQLRGQTIMPTTSERVQTTQQQAAPLQGRVAQGGQALGTFSGVQAQAPNVPSYQSVAAQPGQLPQFQSVQAGSPLISAFQGPSANVQNLAQLTANEAAGLTTAPNRADLAQEAFDIIQARRDPAFQMRLQDVGQRAAALGRTGAGMTTSELNDVLVARERDEDLLQRELSNQSAAMSLQDRLGALQALSGVTGQLFGQDMATAGQRLQTEGAQSSERAGLRGEQRQERGAGLDYALTQLGLDRGFRDEQRGEQARVRGAAMEDFGLGQSFRGEQRQERGALEDALMRRYGLDTDALGTLTGLEGAQRGFERSDRDEVRGERARADQMAEIANQRAIEQAQFESFLQNQLYNQLISSAGAAGNIGYGAPNVLDAIPGLRDEAGRQGQLATNAGQQALMNFFQQRAAATGGDPIVDPTGDPRDNPWGQIPDTLGESA